MSRPNWSVPSQCAGEGGERRAAISWGSGRDGARRGAPTARTIHNVIRPKPHSATGERVNPRGRRRGRRGFRRATVEGAALTVAPISTHSNARVEEGIRNI